MILPLLPDRFEPARDALHGYARVLGALTRAHAPARPHWWHLGLAVRPDGLGTVPVPLPGGGAMALLLDPGSARIEVATSRAGREVVELDGTSPAAALDEVVASCERLGLDGEVDRSRVDDDPVDVDRDAAASFHGVLVDVATVLERRRAALHGAGPLLVWPHGFDLAFEWFGTRRVAGEDGSEAPAQINVGFSPYDGAYFYSNPWPFDPTLTVSPLPAGAAWHLDGWQGTMLPYVEVAGSEDGPDRVLAYADAVFRIARPTLEA